MKKIHSLLRRIKNDKRGNVFIMTGFAIIPLVAATGMGVDYSRAARADTKLRSAADAAALAAVSQVILVSKTNDQARDYARQIFNRQASAIPGFTYVPGDLIINVVGVQGKNRDVTITYSGQSRNLFGSILGLTNLPVSGTTIGKVSRSPNIDFHLVLDTSPSMALPTTDAGATQMSNMVGCQFACHTNNARGQNIYVYDNNATNIVKTMNVSLGAGKFQIDNAGTYVKGTDVFNADDTYADSYWLARNKGITLRIDAERQGAANLMAKAKQRAIDTGATYQAALHTFDYKENFKTLASLTGNLDSVAASAAGIELLGVNRWGGTNGCPSKKNAPVFCNDYRETSYTGALNGANAAISNPGTGAIGDTPQKILFMVTDGISDEQVPGISRTRTEMHSSHIAKCNAIKARGIKIAILYTEYTAASIANDGTQGANVTARLPFVEPALIRCASPGLMYTVKQNESISDELEALFDAATATSRLVK